MLSDWSSCARDTAMSITVTASSRWHWAETKQHQAVTILKDDKLCATPTVSKEVVQGRKVSNFFFFYIWHIHAFAALEKSVIVSFLIQNWADLTNFGSMLAYFCNRSNRVLSISVLNGVQRVQTAVSLFLFMSCWGEFPLCTIPEKRQKTIRNVYKVTKSGNFPLSCHQREEKHPLDDSSLVLQPWISPPGTQSNENLPEVLILHYSI